MLLREASRSIVGCVYTLLLRKLFYSLFHDVIDCKAESYEHLNLEGGQEILCNVLVISTAEIHQKNVQ